MTAADRKLYIFGWPSHLGGADTKLTHLLQLLHGCCDITVVPNENRHLHSKGWTRYLDRLTVKYSVIEKLPARLPGVALAMSNQCFFTRRIAHRAKERGLKIVWSSEMMWHHEGELDAVRDGVIDQVLYTSEFQKSALSANYGKLPWAITGNYIDPGAFPFTPRRNPVFTVGRLSRADPLKYPEDFPVFYEALGLPEVKFRVMAWDDKLGRKYRWHTFDRRWDLLKAEQESQADFLQSLDLFVYPLGHKFRESWGRSTVEAMLTGAIPLVPRGHHFDNLMVHGESGFLCEDLLDYREYSNALFYDHPQRLRIAKQCRQHAESRLCDPGEHRQIWLDALFPSPQGPVFAATDSPSS